MHVRYDERRGEDFKPEDALLGRLLEVRGDKGVAALLAERFADAAQDLDEVGAGAAAGIKDDDARVGEAVGDVEFFAEDRIDAGDLVLDDLGRGVPDAQVFAELGVVGLEERLIEVLDGVFFFELLEEDRAVDALEGGAGPIENFDKIERAQLVGLRNLAKKRGDHRDVKGPPGVVPVERVRAPGVLLVPKDPGGKDAVEEGLDEGGTEEVLAFFAFESETESVFEGLANGGKGGEFHVFDARPCVAGVGGEEPGEIPGFLERGLVHEDALEEFDESLAVLLGECARRDKPERAIIGTERIRLELPRFAVVSLVQEKELAERGNEDEAVASEVATDLFFAGDVSDVFADAFCFDGAAGGRLAPAGFCIGGLLVLVGGEETAVGHPGAEGLHAHEAADFGLEAFADLVEEVFEGTIIGGFGGGGAGAVDILN